MPKKVALITNSNGDLDVSLHDSEEAAQCELMNNLSEIFGDDYDDVPEEYDPIDISEWLSENGESFSWNIQEVEASTCPG